MKERKNVKICKLYRFWKGLMLSLGTETSLMSSPDQVKIIDCKKKSFKLFRRYRSTEGI